MSKVQIRGVFAIIIGFILTVVAGTILSFLAVSVLSTTQVIITAIVIFVIVAPIFGYGIYTYARQSEQMSYQTNEEMVTPRQVLDRLREQGQADISVLANDLGTSADVIHEAIEDLGQLELFSGVANWEAGVITIINADDLRKLKQCKQCQMPIDPQTGKTICTHCGTVYYLSA